MKLLAFALFWSAAALGTWVKQTRVEKDCRSFDSTREACVWNFAVDSSRCPGGRCSKLVLFFNGADMNCARVDGVQKKRLGHLLERYAKGGYAAVTACLYETMRGANELTLGEQVPRVGALYEAIAKDPLVTRHWTGEHLLIAGVSLGASTPVVSMVREPSRLPAAGKTAACFHDGVYDIYAVDKFYWENRRSCSRNRKETICQRYAGKTNCAYPLIHTDETEYDSVGLAALGDLAVPEWKLIECGSRIPKGKCAFPGGDWVPAGPIEAFCKRISADPGHLCQYGSQPMDSHLDCAFVDAGIDRCRLWFDEKVKDFRYTAAKK